MGICFSNSKTTKVTGSGSGCAGGPEAAPAAAATTQDAQARRCPSQRRGRGHRRRPSGMVPCGKRTDFGYDKDFESRYAIGKLLGHGQFGYTFVSTDKATGDRVAVKRIDKNKARKG